MYAAPGTEPGAVTHAVNAGFGERNAGPHHSSGGQQQPADPVTRHREGDDRADHGDRADGESERQRAGERPRCRPGHRRERRQSPASATTTAAPAAAAVERPLAGADGGLSIGSWCTTRRASGENHLTQADAVRQAAALRRMRPASTATAAISPASDTTAKVVW